MHKLNKVKVLLATSALALTLAGTAEAGVLDKVKAHGAVRCGVASDKPGFSLIDDKGHWAGMDVDLCRAVAAAVLGDANKVEYLATTAKNRFTALASGEIDILSRATSWTADRIASLGVDFTTVWFYDGQGFMTHAKDGIKQLTDLDGATFCLSPGTTSEQNLEDYFSQRGLTYKTVVIEKSPELFAAFQHGRCNAISNDLSGLASRLTQMSNPKDYALLPEVISKEPLGAFVAQGDTTWRNIVTWTAYALMTAEELGVTSNNVDELRGKKEAPADIARLLGSQGTVGEAFGLDNQWAYRAIKQVGNYAQIYDRNLGQQTALNFPRGLNRSWKDQGLLYAPPIR
ncbi:amino acid ABC transporter substrate-binding protein [Pseudomonas agarici]|uniref:Amino acid ABC transporter substrate-binding protein n=1 Tax=Pseudomonas agarici TaxID=46677 RepID=A0A0X1T5H1_PSEAA|nr:amino acid ABC transporter substrate-binding protein [Pseudomonas agarici]AMB87212.1 amino acid ABC transporter substrate-binding protein [Pseudomonas agarici]NWB92653.1 amino acid ABC transporter substrate-binding protein [Pseudomonas agarici]NWC10612.1 amino acid ABC transporter substrate-binding protein [Pseudomonas agarici]SEL11204.1 general L-amino acid transport system substrate-binding protein [Pseudomonas agarici]